MLKVSIHADDNVRIGMIEAGAKRRLMTEISRKEEITHPLVILIELLKDTYRAVAASIVNEEKSPVSIKSFESRAQFLVCTR